MSCKYLCQVGALEYASTCSDRCEFPVGAGMIERFWGSGLLPLPLPRPGHQHCARALPPLPLRDPVIESAEHGVYFGRTSERSRWRERERDEGRERQIKDRGREEQADSTNFNISFLRQQSLSSLCLFMSWCCCKSTFKLATGKWPKTFADMIWYNGIKRSVGLWVCVSQLYLFTLVSSI